MIQTHPTWQILALRYAHNAHRTRQDSFVDASNPHAPHPMDFYFWVLRSRQDIGGPRDGEQQVIIVDTGMDSVEGARRGRPLLHEPTDMLKQIGIDPLAVKTLVLTHLHFDHAGCLQAFPNAQVHIQREELDYVHSDALQDEAKAFAYTADHIAHMDAVVKEGRAIIHDGDATIADGVTSHLVGGHSAGLMALKVRAKRTVKLLASDVAHYYESVTARPIFQIVVDEQKMRDGYAWAWSAVEGRLCKLIPAHDPKLRDFYPQIAPDVFDVSGRPGPAFIDLETPVEWSRKP